MLHICYFFTNIFLLWHFFENYSLVQEAFGRLRNWFELFVQIKFKLRCCNFINSITDECGSERPTPDIRFLLQDCVLSFILNNSVNSLSNLQIRDSFEILMTSRFQNCPWFSKLIKNWLSYLRSKVWVSETHTLQFLTISTPISNRVNSPTTARSYYAITLYGYSSHISI